MTGMDKIPAGRHAREPETGTQAAIFRRTALRLLRWGFPVSLIGLIAYRFTQIGWLQIWNAHPSGVAFYLALPLIYLTQPAADWIIYRRLWPNADSPGLLVMLRKRYLDNAVLDYSGEAYFFVWATSHVNLPAARLLHAIKDSNILSAGAGLVLVMLVAWVLAATGALPVTMVAGQGWTVALGVIVPVTLCAMLVAGGRRATVLTRPEIGWTFAIHLLRGLTGLGLEFALWWFSGALPSAIACLEFVALQLLVTRLPIVPNKALIYAGAGIWLSGYLGIPAPPVAAVLIIAAAFDQIAGLGTVGLPWLIHEYSLRDAARS